MPQRQGQPASSRMYTATLKTVLLHRLQLVRLPARPANEQGCSRIANIINFSYAPHEDIEPGTDATEDCKVASLDKGPALLQRHHLLLQLCQAQAGIRSLDLVNLM